MPERTGLPMCTLHSNPENSKEREVQAKQGRVDVEEKLKPIADGADLEDLHSVVNILRLEQ